MGVNFNGDNSYIDFGAIVNNQTVRSVSALICPDDFSNTGAIVYHTGVGWWIGANIDENLMFVQGFSGTALLVKTEASTLTAGLWQHVAVTYDGGGDTVNRPAFYINGASSAGSTAREPSGTIGDDSDGKLHIGGQSVYPTSDPFDGKLQDVRIYNRILSLAEVQQLYYSKCQNVVLNGLVFWAPLNGAAGMPKFEGATMGAANYVRDVISGAIGTPVGNPLGAGNTIQRIR